MAVYKDRIAGTTLTAGTGAVTIVAALPGCRAWSTLTDGDTFVYALEEGTAYEVGEGTWNAGAGTITRGTLRHSSTGAKLALSGNGAVVMLVLDEEVLAEILGTLSSHAGLIAGNASAISTNAGDITALDGRLNSAESGLVSLGSGLSALDSDLTALELVVSGHTTTIGGHTTTIGSHTSSISTLNSWKTTIDNRFDAAAADGTKTTAGGDQLTFSKGLLTAFTQGSGGALDYGNFIEGLWVDSDTDTDHDLRIRVGRCASKDGQAIITCSAETVIALDNGAHLLNGATLGAGKTYHVLVGMAGGSFVAGYSELDQLPAGWDAYRRIFAVRVNASSNLPSIIMERATRAARYTTYSAGFNRLFNYSANTPTTSTSIATRVPLVDGVQALIRIELLGTTANHQLGVRAGTFAHPTNILECQLVAGTVDAAGWVQAGPAWIECNSDSYVRIIATSSAMFGRGYDFGYKVPV